MSSVSESVIRWARGANEKRQVQWADSLSKPSCTLARDPNMRRTSSSPAWSPRSKTSEAFWPSSASASMPCVDTAVTSIPNSLESPRTPQ